MLFKDVLRFLKIKPSMKSNKNSAVTRTADILREVLY